MLAALVAAAGSTDGLPSLAVTGAKRSGLGNGLPSAATRKSESPGVAYYGAPATSCRAGRPTSSTATTVFHIVNNVAGLGLLALSSSMAGAQGKPAACELGRLRVTAAGWGGAAFAAGLATAIGLLSAVAYSHLGQSCAALEGSDFKLHGLWCQTVGARRAWVLDLLVAHICLRTCVMYSNFIGDTVTSFASAAGVSARLNRRWPLVVSFIQH